MKQTALYSAQAALAAKFGSFGGWTLPLYYTSIRDEHETVRTRVGLFDVSHLGHLEIFGPGCLASLQPLVTQDLTRLETGRACYTPMLNEQGFILDEMILYRLEPRKGSGGERFRLVVNAANVEKILDWLSRHLSPPVAVEDLRERVGTLALQGPRAMETLGRVTSDPLSQMPRYSICSSRVAGKPALVARTGYTGEDGCELFVATEDLIGAWEEILEAGRPFGIQPIGLGARDTLRLEAGLPLGGMDLDESTTPLEAGLEWTVCWEKEPFIGRESLERQKAQGVRRRLVGFILRGAGIPRHGYPLFYQGTPTGHVTSGTMLKEAFGMGYVAPEAAWPGTDVSVLIHGRRVPAQVVKLPFYRRKK